MPPIDQEEYNWQKAMWCSTKAVWDTAKDVSAMSRGTRAKLVKGMIQFCGYVPPDDLQAYLHQPSTALRRSGAPRIWPGGLLGL